MGVFGNTWGVNGGKSTNGLSLSISNQTFSIAENSANGTIVGTVIATGPGVLSYQIISGNGAGAFAIDSTTGVVTVADVLIYSIISSYNITLRVTNEYGHDDATVIINITEILLTDSIKNKMLFLWTGQFLGNNLLSDIDTTQIVVNSKDFITSYIPVNSTSLFNAPSSFTIPDTDNIWWYNGSVRNVTVSELIGSDFARTFIKYDSASPHHIRAIAILKTGETLTNDEANVVKFWFKLPFMWSGNSESYGMVKANRGLIKKTWSAEPIYDSNAQALFTRMIGAGDTPTTARKAIINQVFVDLKSNGLYTGFADFVYMFKAAAKSSANLNWLADAYNATDQGGITFTNDFGYTGTVASTTKYIRTNYNPNTNKVNVSQNNFAFSFWLNENITHATHGLCGAYATSWTAFFSYVSTAGIGVNDNGGWYDAALPNKQGLITIERINSNIINIYRNGVFVTAKTLNSTAIPNLEFYIMKVNGYQGSLGGKMQFFAIHRAMSAGEHATFYSIINNYMGSF